MLSMRFVTVGGLAVLLPALCASGQVTYRVSVRSGQLVPDHNAQFSSIDPYPVLNASGRVMFHASFYPINFPGVDGIWTEQNGVLTPSALVNEAAPGPWPVGFFGRLYAASLTNNGTVAFGAAAYVNAADSFGIWTRRPNEGYQFTNGSGQSAPGLPGLMFQGTGGPQLNDAGHLFFSASLSGPDVSDANNIALYRDRGAGPVLIARTGDQAPTEVPGRTFRSFDTARMNSAGNMVFSAVTVDAQGVGTRGIWSDRSGSLQPVLRSGDPTPGGTLGQTVAGMSSGHLSSSGRMVIFGTSTGGPGGTTQGCIWSDRSGTMTTLVRGGDAAGPGLTFYGLGGPVTNQASRIAFEASLQGTGVGPVNQYSLWTDAHGPLTMVARGGQHAPGAGAVPVFLSFESPLLNNNGQVAFVASLWGSTINDNNDRGIWATDLQGNLVLVAREGDLFDVNPDPTITDLHRISSLSMLGGHDANDPLGMVFNDSGELVFNLSFTDVAGGIYVATIPAPSAAGLFALLSLAATRRRARDAAASA